MNIDDFLYGAKPYSKRKLVCYDKEGVFILMQEKLDQIFYGLTQRELSVMKLLWGYYGNMESYETAADHLRITLEEVVFVEHVANKKIYTPEKLLLLRELYEITN